jgi:DedD protein
LTGDSNGMATTVSEQELQLRKRARRRLMGAIVLVAAVAVILPMVLDPEPQPTSQDINIKIPSPDSKGFTSKVVPLAPPAKGDRPLPKSTEVPAATAKAPEPAPVATVAEKPAPKAMIEKPAAKVPEKALEKAAAPKTGTFFIQVTALADTDRAKQVQQRIIDAGFPAYTQVIPAGKGSVTRVRAGPFVTRDEADKAQAALKAAGLEGKVAANP